MKENQQIDKNEESSFHPGKKPTNKKYILRKILKKNREVVKITNRSLSLKDKPLEQVVSSLNTPATIDECGFVSLVDDSKSDDTNDEIIDHPTIRKKSTYFLIIFHHKKLIISMRYQQKEEELEGEGHLDRRNGS